MLYIKYLKKINFDNFGNSFLAIFLNILNEEWHMTMYDYMRNTSDIAALFWIFIIITGEVIVMKLFLALFINNYLQILKSTNNFIEDDKNLETDDKTEDIEIESESNSDSESDSDSEKKD